MYPDHFPLQNNCTIAVIGLGYVGLPLAVEFGKMQTCILSGSQLNRRVIGFDINKERVEELKRKKDRTHETSVKELEEASNLEFTNDPKNLYEADVFIVTVPTPIDSTKRPDLSPLEKACKTIGFAVRERNMQQKEKKAYSMPVIIFESTVYPGATEEICVPIIEKESKLHFNSSVPNQGFVCGYSPERINPGDPNHRLTTITKVTSGSTAEAANFVNQLYGSIINAGTHMAPSLKVAEAAKVIENTQRDLNIALVNELAIIFSCIGIDTLDVLAAAETKWNFLKFKPGLVGGHCIGIDPYYLTYKAEQLGYQPQVVLAGRRINDNMAIWIVEQMILKMAKNKLVIGGAKVLIMGLSFKEDCPDIRNTRVIDIINCLRKYEIEPTIIDPCVDIKEVNRIYNLNILQETPQGEKYDGVIISVAHREFIKKTQEYWESLINKNGVFIDAKGILNRKIDAIRI